MKEHWRAAPLLALALFSRAAHRDSEPFLGHAVTAACTPHASARPLVMLTR